MQRGYKRLDVLSFGRQLFESQDLDPIYVALLGLDLSPEVQARWLLSYWLFYNAGFASWVSESKGSVYWNRLRMAAENVRPTPFYGRWPRGAERRHFRGKVAVSCVEQLAEKFSEPLLFIDRLCTGPMDVRSVIERVKEHYLFGNWIAFKVADMLDAVVGESVAQDDLTAFLYDTPRRSILEGWREKRLPLRATSEEEALGEGMVWLKEQLHDCKVPHKLNQAPDWFSLETVWCKHLSHLHGHYPLWKDIHEISQGLQPWLSHSDLAKTFYQEMPKERKCMTLLS